jgi:hypothetical protein
MMALGGLMAMPADVRAGQAGSQTNSETQRTPVGLIFAGIRGSVVAIERATGNLAWHTHLTGGDFVNVIVSGGSIYGSTRGEIYCLDPGTGAIRWHNELKGYGRGLMTMATAEVSGNQAAVIRAKRRQEEQAVVVVQPTIY